MVKLGHAPVGPTANVPQATVDRFVAARRRFATAAVSCFVALVGSAADMQQPGPDPASGSDSNAAAAGAAAGAAASMLPGLFLFGTLLHMVGSAAGVNGRGSHSKP
jgi:hypothetical protein